LTNTFFLLYLNRPTDHTCLYVLVRHARQIESHEDYLKVAHGVISQVRQGLSVIPTPSFEGMNKLDILLDMVEKIK
jgi:hypothetical protein